MSEKKSDIERKFEKIEEIIDIFDDMIINARDEANFKAQLLDAQHECNIHGIDEKCNEIEDLEDNLQSTEKDINKLLDKLREVQEFPLSSKNNGNNNPTEKETKFDPCFDPEKIKKFQEKVPKIIAEIRKLTSKKIKDFPQKIECMTPKEITAGKLRGAGHGLYIPGKKIAINPNMASKGIALNFIHENLHHALPELSEKVIDILTTHIGCESDILEDDICDFFKKVE